MGVGPPEQPLGHRWGWLRRCPAPAEAAPTPMWKSFSPGPTHPRYPSQLSGRAEARSSPVAWLDVTHTCQRLRASVSCLCTWQAVHAHQRLSLYRHG